MSGSKTRPWWLGLGTTGLGGIWLNGALSLDIVAKYGGIGPGLFVGLVGAGMVLLGIVLTIRIGLGERFEPQATEDMTPDAPFSLSGFLLATTAAAVPLATMQPIGFPVTAALVFALVAHAFGARPGPPGPTGQYQVGRAIGGASRKTPAHLNLTNRIDM